MDKSNVMKEVESARRFIAKHAEEFAETLLEEVEQTISNEWGTTENFSEINEVIKESGCFSEEEAMFLFDSMAKKALIKALGEQDLD